jgi:hypothetical protein
MNQQHFYPCSMIYSLILETLLHSSSVRPFARLILPRSCHLLSRIRTENYFTNYNGNKTLFQKQFPELLVQKNFGMSLFWRTPEPMVRTAPANMCHWTSKYGNNSFPLPAAAVELLQTIPFLWVDASPMGSETYSVQLHPVDAYSIEGWIKMNKLGLISPSLQASLEDPISDRAQLTTQLVNIALADLAGRLFGAPVVQASPTFRTVKFLLPTNDNLIDADTSARIFEWMLLWASDNKITDNLELPTMAFSDILALVRLLETNDRKPLRFLLLFISTQKLAYWLASFMFLLIFHQPFQRC